MNNFSCTGNLGSTADVRQVGSTTLCTFSIAVKAGYGDKESTMWIRANLWGKKAESRLPEFLQKGALVGLTGELSINVFTNKDGVEKTSLEMRVGEVDLLGGKPKQDSQPVQRGQQEMYKTDEYQGNGDTVPF